MLVSLAQQQLLYLQTKAEEKLSRNNAIKSKTPTYTPTKADSNGFSDVVDHHLHLNGSNDALSLSHHKDKEGFKKYYENLYEKHPIACDKEYDYDINLKDDVEDHEKDYDTTAKANATVKKCSLVEEKTESLCHQEQQQKETTDNSVNYDAGGDSLLPTGSECCVSANKCFPWFGRRRKNRTPQKQSVPSPALMKKVSSNFDLRSRSHFIST